MVVAGNGVDIETAESIDLQLEGQSWLEMTIYHIFLKLVREREGSGGGEGVEGVEGEERGGEERGRLTPDLALKVKYLGKVLSLKNRNVTLRIPFSCSTDV